MTGQESLHREHKELTSVPRLDCKKEPAMARASQTEATASAKALRCKHDLKMPGMEGRPGRLDQSESSYGGNAGGDGADDPPPREETVQTAWRAQVHRQHQENLGVFQR